MDQSSISKQSLQGELIGWSVGSWGLKSPVNHRTAGHNSRDLRIYIMIHEFTINYIGRETTRRRNNKKKFIRLHPTEVHELHNGCSYSWLSQRVWLTSSLTLGVFFLVASEGTITDPSSFTMSPLQKKQNTIFVSQFSRLYKFTYITLKSSFVFQTIMHITWSNLHVSRYQRYSANAPAFEIIFPGSYI